VDCAGKTGEFAADAVRRAKSFYKISREHEFKSAMEDLIQHLGLHLVELLDGGFQSGASIERGADESS